ncbi:uroporphyrinogen-III synthase [Aequorivita marina]|uniref:uroporphyrinogen-III synthase n=1 Tax=Aequorivita marina TaxID=3073654 RepID=UPI002876BDB4|nr:uroporphyrinogen-III synthase [Aequorivita sp. S2608]MDS1297463.1 uroporphyrinogen-III synthase [Aequorivita sp. S2608]
MKSVLSTKKLTSSQRGLLINAGVSLVEYNAIQIEPLTFKTPLNIENAIFTSQNGVHSFVSNVRSGIENTLGLNSVANCYCVGQKTKALLEKNGAKVVKMTEYASELAPYLVENHKNEHFYFFCGNIRSDVIPSVLSKNNVSFEEINVYKTTLSPKKFERQFDAILFFSPSGVRSFFEANLRGMSEKRAILVGFPKVVCIGTTTASEAKKYTDNVVISNSTTVESVIAKAVKVLT